MDVQEIAKKRNEIRAQINNLITDFVKDTGCSVEIDIRKYQEIGKPSRPIIDLLIIIP